MRERKFEPPAPIPKEGLKQLEQLLKQPKIVQERVLNQTTAAAEPIPAQATILRPQPGTRPAPSAEFTPLHPQLPVTAPVQRMTKTLADSAAMREVLRRVLSRQR